MSGFVSRLLGRAKPTPTPTPTPTPARAAMNNILGNSNSLPVSRLKDCNKTTSNKDKIECIKYDLDILKKEDKYYFTKQRYIDLITELKELEGRTLGGKRRQSSKRRKSSNRRKSFKRRKSSNRRSRQY
jgi:hypothetical protein